MSDADKPQSRPEILQDSLHKGYGNNIWVEGRIWGSSNIHDIINGLRLIADPSFQFPEIKAHFQKNIGDVYKGLDLNFRGFPEDNVRDAEACEWT